MYHLDVMTFINFTNVTFSFTATTLDKTQGVILSTECVPNKTTSNSEDRRAQPTPSWLASRVVPVMAEEQDIGYRYQVGWTKVLPESRH
jgi:hypothetical protein